MCGLITRQLRTAIELYREAIRFTAKSRVYKTAFMRFRENVWMSDYVKRGGKGSAGSHSMPSATVALKKPFKSFSLFLSLAKTMSIKFSTRVKQKQTPKNQRELPTEKFTTISQERCLQFTTTKYLRRWRERRTKQTPKSAAAILFQMLCTAFFLSSNDHLLMCTYSKTRLFCGDGILSSFATQLGASATVSSV